MVPKPVVDHVGVLVEDLELALAMFEGVFGLEQPAIKEMPAVGLRSAMLEFANLKVELLQYSRADSEFKPVLGEHMGMNHLSLITSDLGQVSYRLAQRGIPMAPGFPRQGSRGRLAFNQPGPAQGMLFELYELEDKK